jgi:hypothetical protein
MKLKILSVVSLTLILSGCLQKEYQPVPPQLKIIVHDISGVIVNEAVVKLYSNKEDFLSEEQLIDFGLTDSSGTIVFVDLEETIYYFKIGKGEKSNLESNFFFKEPLKMGERKTIITSIF